MNKTKLAANIRAAFMVTLFTMVWATFMLVGFGVNPFSVIGFVILIGYSVWLLITVMRTMRQVRALPDLAPDETQRRAQKRTSKAFGIIFTTEIALILVAMWAFGSSTIGNPNFISPVIALIVGAHFYPLAVLFRKRIHAVLATVIVLAAFISIIVIALGYFIHPMNGLCCLVTALCTAIMSTYLLRDVHAAVKRQTQA